MIYTLLFILTLLQSAFFSGSETAYVASNRLKLHVLYRDPTKNGTPNVLLQSDQRFLTTTLVGNNIVMVACSSLAVIVFSPFLSEAVLVLVTTTFLLIFGEILPKSIATLIPNRLTRFTPQILALFYFVFYPLIWLAESLAGLLVRLSRQERGSARLFSKIDLPILISEYSTSQAFTKQDQALFSRALRFREKRLWDIMVPRTDIIGVDLEEEFLDIRNQFRTSGFSRLPAYRDHLDQIEGFFYVLDFYAHLEKDMPPLRPALFLPESMKVMEALQTLQHKRQSIAIAVDEHGGTAGLVTFEDIVEKLVGAIADEFDKPKVRVRSSGQQTVIADGKTSIDELRELENILLPEGDYVTIGGLLEDKMEVIPQTGDSIQLGNYSIEVLDANSTKVLKVRIVHKKSLSNADNRKVKHIK